MKRLVALLLSLNLFVVGLMPAGDAHGLVDAATLWQHHATDHAATGFWDFYYDHYVGDHHNSPEHQSLPGHHAHQHLAGAVCFFPAPVLRPWPAALLLLEAAPVAALHIPAACQGSAPGCWQPPRA